RKEADRQLDRAISRQYQRRLRHEALADEVLGQRCTFAAALARLDFDAELLRFLRQMLPDQSEQQCKALCFMQVMLAQCWNDPERIRELTQALADSYAAHFGVVVPLDWWQTCAARLKSAESATGAGAVSSNRRVA